MRRHAAPPRFLNEALLLNLSRTGVPENFAMTYLSPAFKYDIFISYARVNDQRPPGHPDIKGWVTLFHEYLEKELAERFGRSGKVEIWRDTRNMGGNTVFDDEIRESIEESAIFLALTSLGYVSEESYCPKELKRFHDKASGESYGLTIGNRHRILKLLLQNIGDGQNLGDAEWPREFQGTEGFPFHNAERREQLGRATPHDERLFSQQLEPLVEAIDQTLRNFKAKVVVTPSRKPGAPPAGGSYSVFLGHAEGELGDLRGRVYKELRNLGVRITSEREIEGQAVYEVPPPFEPDRHEQSATEAIRAADLSVHLLDNAPGWKIFGDREGKTYYRKQVELGMRHAKSQLIWYPRPLEINAVKDAGHKSFLEQLDQEGRENTQFCFVREPATLITTEIMTRLARLKEEESAKRTRAARIRALLDNHLSDQAFASRLSSVLTRKMDLLINPAEDAPQSSMGMLPKLLKRVSVLIIVFGCVTRDWVQSRLNNAVQVVVENKCPLKLLGIYLPPLNGAGTSRQVELQPVPAPFPIYLFESPDDLDEVLDDLL